MIATNTYRACGMIVVISLFLTNICYSQNTKAETIDSKNSVATPVISGDSTTTLPNGEPIHTTNPSGFIEKIEYNIHKIIREERIKTLDEIDKERQTILLYLTSERLAATDDLKTELNSITKIMMSERRATMIELEEIGNRVVENALLKSERLIDHFFVRTLQLMAVMTLTGCVLASLFFFIRGQRKNQS